MAIFYLQLYTKYSWYLWYPAVVCHNLTIYVSANCQNRALITLLAHQDYVTTQWDIDQISKASLAFNQSFYYLLGMCCNGTLDQKYKHSKMKHFQLNPSSVFNTLTPNWEWYHQSFNTKIPTTSCYTQNSKIPFKEILPFFSQIHKVNDEWPLQAIWNHPSDLFAFAQNKQLFLTAGTAFSW